MKPVKSSLSRWLNFFFLSLTSGNYYYYYYFSKERERGRKLIKWREFDFQAGKRWLCVERLACDTELGGNWIPLWCDHTCRPRWISADPAVAADPANGAHRIKSISHHNQEMKKINNKNNKHLSTAEGCRAGAGYIFFFLLPNLTV